MYIVCTVPPTVLRSPASYTLPAAKTISTECVVDGTPSPFIGWIFNSEYIYEDSEIVNEVCFPVYTPC